MSLLHLAARDGVDKCVKLIIDAGADVTLVDRVYFYFHLTPT